MKKMTVEAWKKCPICGRTENQVRAGYNGSGSQRCKCKECGKYYAINPKQHTYPEETRKLALKMYYGGSSRNPRQILGHTVSYDKSAKMLQKAVNMALCSEIYCTDGYNGYLDTIFPGKHIFNSYNKNDTLTVEGVNADLRHYIPTLARRSRCFSRKLENLQAAFTVFVTAYNRFGLQKARYRSLHPDTSIPFFDFL